MYIRTVIKRENILTDTTTFEWDNNKNILNQKRYKISFEEAQYAFSDSKKNHS